MALQDHLQIEIVKLLREEGRDRARPVRQCAVGRTRGPEDDLLRFVLDPDQRVVPDLKRKLPGRGVWVTAERAAVDKAVKQKSFARGFRQPVTVDPDLAGIVEDLLRRAALQDLALANKAGCIVAGSTKVGKALTGERRMVLLHAADAAPDGRRKLDRLVAKAGAEADGDIPSLLTAFTSGELSAALGRQNVMHTAITQDGAGRKFIGSALRYLRYAGAYPDNASVAGSSLPTSAPEQDTE